MIRGHFIPAAPRVLAGLLLMAVVHGTAHATPIQYVRTLHDVDWTSAAISGVGGSCGGSGAGMFHLSGVQGPITHAWLYWHGVDAQGLCATNAATGGDREHALLAQGALGMGSGCDGVYDHPMVRFNGSVVVGTPIGDATTNCWGTGSSRAYRADVTSLVGGNGKIPLRSIGGDDCDDLNGASLVVTFNDGNPLNDRDLVFFEGNDSNFAEGFPGESDGWHATLPGIHYSDGAVNVQAHVADGQNLDGSGLDDGDLQFSAGGAPFMVSDAIHRYDGDSASDSRSGRGHRFGREDGLWDVHTFDVTPLFTGEDTYTLQMDGMLNTEDCLGLVLLLVDLQAGSSPVPVVQGSWGRLKSLYR